MTRPAADTAEPNTPIGRIRVLVVDDDPQVGSRLRDLLTDFDHTVVGLASPASKLWCSSRPCTLTWSSPTCGCRE